MDVLRLILVYALVAQLGAAYRCCPTHKPCQGSADTATCSVASSCCNPPPVTTTCCPATSGECDESEHDSTCPCCSANLLTSKEPMEGLPSSDGPSLDFLAFPAIAPAFAQPDELVCNRQFQRRIVHARPTIERLAQLSVWRT